MPYAAPAFAGSGTWSANPGSGDWNMAANWLSGTVPNATADVATFDSSSVTGISISANTGVYGIVFNAGASAYTITASPTFTLTLSGVGIINNSGNTQSFVAAVNGTSGLGTMIFSNAATAGSNTAFTVNGATTSGASGGDIEFRDSSTAGGGAFTLNGSAGGAGGGIVGFSDASSAGNGVFTVNGPSPGGGSGTGYLQFHGVATAGNGTITNNGGAAGYTGGGNTQFYNNSSAGSGTFTNTGGGSANAYGGHTAFNNTSSAGNGTFTNNGGSVGSNANGGDTTFYAGSTVGNATFINNAAQSSGALGGATTIYSASTTANGTFINNGGAVVGAHGGSTTFNSANGGNTAVSAGTSTFTNNGGSAVNTGGGFVEFWYATAGSATFINNGGTGGSNSGGGLVHLYYGASAGSATFTNYAGTVSGANGGAVVFHYSSSAANGTFINNGSAVSGASAGSTQFFDWSLAGTATITNNGGTGDGANGADTDFYTASSAENSTVTNNGGTVSGALGGKTQFRTSATASNATVTANAGTVSGALGGTTQFWDSATAGNATLIANGGTGGGGSIQFNNDTTGGTARVKLYDNGNLDISSHNSGVTIGSLEGNGNVFLGARTLTVGSKILDTTFSGVIQDGGAGGGTAGKLTKIGSSTLTLTGANTFTGATAVNGGTLVADTALNASVLNSSSTLALGGGTFQLKGNSGVQSQTLAGLTVNAGASVVDVNNLGTSTTLDLGAAITRAAGGTVDFKASNGTMGTDALIKTSQANANGILGGWATVNGGAALATKNGSNAIVAYTGYTALDAQGGAITDDSTLNYGINAAGTNGNVSLAAATTNINTLTQNFSTAATVDTTGKTLRVGTSGGIFITPTMAALTIGTTANAGTLMAGGATTNVAGELILSNFSASAFTINSTIANNGTGAVSLTKSGAGPVVINGTNTFTGGTVLNSGTLTLGNTSALGIAAKTVKLTGGTLDLATDTTVNAWNTTVTSSATIQSDKATAASAGITHTLGTLGIGTQTLTIGAGANVAADSNFGITFGATTLSGDAIFNVAKNGAGIGTLTLGRVTDGGIRTITKTGAGTLIFGTAATSTSITYGTSLVVNNGVAQVNIANALGTSTTACASVTVNATTAATTAVFSLNNVSQRIARLTFGGTGGTSTSINNIMTGSGTLTLAGDYSFDDITYDATGNPLGSTLSGIVALGDNRFFNVGDSSNADADLTISANLTGSTTSGVPSITKTGAGTLVLSGANTFNRGLGINAGVVSVATLPTGTTGSSTVGTGGTVQFGGGTLRYTGATQTTSHVFAGTTGGGGIEITQSGTVLTISSAFAGWGQGAPSDALVKSGPGTLAFTGSTDNAGLDVTVNAGLLQLSKASSSTKHAIGQNLVVNSGGGAQLGTAGSGGDQIQNEATVTVNTGGTFDFNAKSESFDGLSGSGGSITNTGTANSTMTVGANNHLAGATTFGGVISDGATNKILFTKTGRGTQTLTGANTYTGATTINGGKLIVDGSLSASSAVAVNSTGILGGHGTVGAVTINSGGKISPGNSPGTMTTGTETWAVGGGYVWELNNPSDAGGAKGVSYDWLNIGGTLNITATSGSKFTIYVTSLTAGNAAGSIAGFNPGTTYHWVIASAASVTNFSADKFLIDTSAFFNAPGTSNFTITNVGNDILLNVTNVPEPREYAVAIAVLLGMVIALRRRREGRRN